MIPPQKKNIRFSPKIHLFFYFTVLPPPFQNTTVTYHSPPFRPPTSTRSFAFSGDGSLGYRTPTEQTIYLKKGRDPGTPERGGQKGSFRRQKPPVTTWVPEVVGSKKESLENANKKKTEIDNRKLCDVNEELRNYF